MKLKWLGRDQPVMFEDDFIVSEPSTEFEKTTFADCTKTSYDGGNLPFSFCLIFLYILIQ